MIQTVSTPADAKNAFADESVTKINNNGYHNSASTVSVTRIPWDSLEMLIDLHDTHTIKTA